MGHRRDRCATTERGMGEGIEAHRPAVDRMDNHVLESARPSMLNESVLDDGLQPQREGSRSLGSCATAADTCYRQYL